MNKLFAIALMAGTVGIAGCASDPKSASTPSASKDEEVFTGSRLPRKVSTDQPSKTISGDTWRRDSTSVIGSQPRGN
jgi:hypothetical protein